jgi:hypothetical protein
LGRTADKYFLTSGFTLKKNTGASGAIQTIDVAVDKSAFKLFGTWNYVMP